MEAALRTLKIIWGALLSAVLVYVYLCAIASVKALPNPVLFRGIVIVAAGEVVVLFLLRQRLLTQATEVLRTQPDDNSALGKWRSGNILSWALGLSIALYGLVLRYMGFDFRQVVPFFAVGFCLILLLPPRRPTAAR
jgi:hypothetical protein